MMEVNEDKENLINYEKFISNKPNKRQDYLDLVCTFLQSSLSSVVLSEQIHKTEDYNKISQNSLGIARFAAWNFTRLEEALTTSNTKRKEMN